MPRILLKLMLHCVELVCILLYVVFFTLLHYVVCGCLYDEIQFYISMVTCLRGHDSIPSRRDVHRFESSDSSAWVVRARSHCMVGGLVYLGTGPSISLIPWSTRAVSRALYNEKRRLTSISTSPQP
jgi:hypothetical protein